MNTFGAFKYLEAEQNVVDELIISLKDRLNKLKIEELAIRAEIRTRMKTGSMQSCPSQLGTVEAFLDKISRSENAEPSTSQNPCQPIEMDIDDALRIIGNYRQQSGVDEVPTQDDTFKCDDADTVQYDLEEFHQLTEQK